MPRRDVVLTGVIAFAAGVAVGANWGKLRKKIGPMLEKLGLQVADLGDFLSASGMEDFAAETMQEQPKAKRRRSKAKAAPNSEDSEDFIPSATRRNGRQAEFTSVRSAPQRKTSRRKPVVVRETAVPLATGTFGH
jgi:hypothetical protein